MARIKQIGPGRRTLGNIDGINYYFHNGETFARANPLMPARTYTSPEALKRRAIFTMVQKHLKYHLRTIRQTFTPKGNGNAINRYYSMNGKHFTRALDTLADLMVAGEDVTITDIEEAICAYAAANPNAIIIAHLNGYGDVYLTGEWPDTITLRADGGQSTIIVIVAENGTTTTRYPDGTTVVTAAGESTGSGSGSSTGSEQGGNSGSGSGSGSGSSTGSDPSTGSETTTVEAPNITGTTPFEETTTVTISGPAQATVYYTTDGATPTASSTQYSEAFTLSDTTTVKAIAVKDGVSSSVASRTFTKGNGGGSASGQE